MSANSSQSGKRTGTDQTFGLWNLHENLHRLADELATAAREIQESAGNDNPAPQAEPRDYFQSLLQVRRTRDQYFGGAPFSEPAWDIMLELMLARIDGREMRVSELAASAAFPAGVMNGHLDALEQARLIDRFDNTENQNDHFIALSSEAARRMAELYRARMLG